MIFLKEYEVIMKFMGSKMAKIQCIECPELSEPFRVTLCDESEEKIFLYQSLPKGWEMPEDAGLYDDIIYGYCPKHLSSKPIDEI
jgi:hypothetical protein